MQEADLVDGFDGTKDLVAEAQRRRKAEGSPGLGAAQFRKVFGLKLHHYIVEALVPSTPDETTHVLATCTQRHVGQKCDGGEGRKT